MHDIQALLPDCSTTLDTAELTTQQSIEPIQMMLCPPDAGTTHHAGEALLIDADRVLDEIEVDVRNLEDIQWQISFKYTSPMSIRLVLLGGQP